MNFSKRKLAYRIQTGVGVLFGLAVFYALLFLPQILEDLQ